jgi:hypothetical protein
LVIPDADDVAEGVNYASRIGLRVAVQGTGHGGAALGPLARRHDDRGVCDECADAARARA